MSEDQRLYAPPSLSALTAYVSTAVVLFFAGFNFNIFSDLERLKKEFVELKEENVELRNQIAMMDRDLGDGRLYVDQSRYAPAPSRPMAAPAPRAARPVEPPVAPAPTVSVPESGPEPQVAATVPEPAAAKPAVPVNPAPADLVEKIEPEAVEDELASGPIALASPPSPRVIQPDPAGTDASDVIHTDAKAETSTADPVPLDTTPSAAAMASAQVLATNPDQQRAIVSLGASNGVEPGRRFQVYRGSQWVGDVTVAKVFADMSMCDISQNTTRGIRKGDIARLVQVLGGSGDTN